MGRGLSLGVIIAIVLIVYWWIKDHPHTPPATQGYERHYILQEAS